MFLLFVDKNYIFEIKTSYTITLCWKTAYGNAVALASVLLYFVWPYRPLAQKAKNLYTNAYRPYPVIGEAATTVNSSLAAGLD